MDRAIADFMVEALDSEGYEASIYEDYSGRGMFGKTTTGVVTDAPSGKLLAVCLREAAGLGDNPVDKDVREALADAGDFFSDSLGRDTIYY